MNTYYITSVFLLVTFFGHTQVTTQLDANNVNATFSQNGYFFTSVPTTTHGYEVPAGSNNHAIFSGSFWFGGTDVNGQLKLAAQQYFGADYFDGPICRYEGTADSAATNYFGQTVWKVSQDEINDHIANYQSSTYTMPNDIANWPAHGDTAICANGGMLPFIAPFVDVNGNGVYDPGNGDYPCIKGDLAVYTILNDIDGAHTASLGEPIGIELHCMFYQYNSIPELNDVTFMDIEVVNMGTQSIFDTRAGFFLDTDLGNYGDDYIGTDTLRNMTYVYNADNFDEPMGVGPGYGNAPPAVGLKLLSHDLMASMSYTNSATYPMGDPNNALEYYLAMDGKHQDGSVQLDGNGNPTTFAYYGDPNDSMSWSEFQLSNAPGDRRFVASTNIGFFSTDQTYAALNRETFSYAIVYAKGTDHLNSVTELKNVADFVQNHYDNMTSNCFDLQLANVEELQEIEFSVYPNPNSGTFNVELSKDLDNAMLEIIDAQGRKVHIRAIFSGENTIDAALQSGIYFLRVKSGNASSIERIVIR